MAQRLDLARRALTGDPVTLADAVASDGNISRIAVAVSATGLVAYRGGRVSRRQLTWVDGTGKVLSTLGAPDEHTLQSPRVAQDGRRVAVQRTVQGNTDLWLLDGARTSRLTFDAGGDRGPIWSPDGRWLVFDSDRTGMHDLYGKDASGAGVEARLVASAQTKIATDWSADGRFLLYDSLDPQTGGGDLWAQEMDPCRPPRQALGRPAPRAREARRAPSSGPPSLSAVAGSRRMVAGSPTSRTRRGGRRSMFGRGRPRRRAPRPRRPVRSGKCRRRAASRPCGARMARRCTTSGRMAR